MKAYLVCCDFKKGSGAESAITGILNSYRGIRFQTNSWVIITLEDSKDIYGKLSDWHTSEDYILVTKMTDDTSGSQPVNIRNWLRRNVV